MRRNMWLALAIPLALLVATNARAQSEPPVLTRDGGVIALEPYAPNIIRVTLSLDKNQATAPPGYGFAGYPAPGGWTYRHDESGDVYSSSRMTVTIAAEHPHEPMATQVDIAKFFHHSASPHIIITTADGKKLLEMTGWNMRVPNYKDGTAGELHDERPSDKPFYQVGAAFVSPSNEHYYGLGQNQEGYLDHRGHPVDCWHNYRAAGGPNIGIPFVVTNLGYGMIWDNPSKTTINPGFNEQANGDSQHIFRFSGSSRRMDVAFFPWPTGFFRHKSAFQSFLQLADELRRPQWPPAKCRLPNGRYSSASASSTCAHSAGVHSRRQLSRSSSSR